MKKQTIRAITVCGVFGALGFVLMLLDFPLPFIIPPFIKFDFSEIPAVIASFAFGPLYGILVCLIKNVLHLFVTNTNGVGELSNFILGGTFVGIAGIVYKRNKSRKYALIGTVVGALVMSIISIVTNYFIVYPFYGELIIPIPVIIDMYKAILPVSDTLLKCLLIFNLPFNFIKGLVNATVCFAIYKKISPILKYGFKNKKIS